MRAGPALRPNAEIARTIAMTQSRSPRVRAPAPLIGLHLCVMISMRGDEANARLREEAGGLVGAFIFGWATPRDTIDTTLLDRIAGLLNRLRLG